MLSTLQPFCPTITMESNSVGVDLGGALALPPGGRVFYVRGNGTSVTQYADDQINPERAAFQALVFPSVAVALTKCVAGRGDRIVVFPGHTENISSATTWAPVANVKIIGVGVGSERPTFVWTAAAGKINITVAKFGIHNCRFLCSGLSAAASALTTTLAFGVAADGVTFSNNYFEVGINATHLTAGFMTTTAAGDNLTFVNNEVATLATAAEVTTGLVLVGADYAKIENNYFFGAMAATTTGWIAASTTLSARVSIKGNHIVNSKASSTVALDLTANLANTGWVSNNMLRVNSGTAPFGSIHASNNLQLEDNYVFNTANYRGLIVGTASS